MSYLKGIENCNYPVERGGAGGGIAAVLEMDCIVGKY